MKDAILNFRKSIFSQGHHVDSERGHPGLLKLIVEKVYMTICGWIKTIVQ
jgi:hypothetical protein